MYLGDGHVAAFPRTHRLEITCDASYPGLIEAAWAAIALTGLPGRVRIGREPDERCIRVSAYSRRWPEAFPQHGPGRKHNRKIELAPWQREVVDRFPEQFLCGLLHSDGCRTINRFQTKLPSGRIAEYAYPRWFFSNKSADIRALFCEYCDRLGSGGRSRTRGTSRSRIEGALRSSTRSCRPSREPSGRGAIDVRDRQRGRFLC
jgi:hypothetical protein